MIPVLGMTRGRITANDRQIGNGPNWSMASVSHYVVAFRLGNAAHVPKDHWFARRIRRPGTSVRFAFRRNTAPQIIHVAARAEAKAAKAKAVDVAASAVVEVVLEVAAAMVVAIGTAAKIGEIGGDCDLHRRAHHERDTCMM